MHINLLSFTPQGHCHCPSANFKDSTLDRKNKGREKKHETNKNTELSLIFAGPGNISVDLCALCAPANVERIKYR